MDQFPTTIPIADPLDITPVFDTLISGLDSAAEQRRSRRTWPLYDVTVRFNQRISESEMAVLWAFYCAQKGAGKTFAIYDLAALDYATQYVGTADGATTIWDLPGKGTASQVIYVDDAVQASGITILTGGGDAASDRVQFAAAPAEGGIITADFSGYLRILARFAQDKMTRSMFSALLFGFQAIDLKGVKA